MRVANLIAIIALFIIPLMLLTACDKVIELFDTTSKAVKEEITKKQEQVTVQAGKVVDNTRRYAEEQLDKTQQQLLAAVQTVTEKVVTQTKIWIFEALKPFFPWIFILFFLSLFAALKAIIPFSNIFLIQLPLVLTSYIFSFWLFAKQELSSFALIGTLWLFIPVAITTIIFYLGRSYFKPKILALNSKLVSSFTGQSIG
jgi:hypothetical protein